MHEEFESKIFYPVRILRTFRNLIVARCKIHGEITYFVVKSMTRLETYLDAFRCRKFHNIQQRHQGHPGLRNNRLLFRSLVRSLIHYTKKYFTEIVPVIWMTVQLTIFREKKISVLGIF